MAKFQIYIDETVQKKDYIELGPNQKLSFDSGKIYPGEGLEFSFEELYLSKWRKSHEASALMKRILFLERENCQLQDQVQSQQETINSLQKQLSKRASILPQSLEIFGADNDFSTNMHDWERTTIREATDKFTVPINNSQYIKENLVTSTPSSKDDANRRPHNFNRRKSRPSLGGSPTLKLSPITETSRECNSKSSSSTSSLATVKKVLLTTRINEEDEKPVKCLGEEEICYRQLLYDLLEEIDFIVDEHEKGFKK